MASVQIYSFTNIQGVFAYSPTKSFTFGGSEAKGIVSITISQANDNTIHDISVDGGIFVLPVLVYNGTISIECQQTSTFHLFLIDWFNNLKTEAKVGTSTGNASESSFKNWANAVMLINQTSSSSTSVTRHLITGISPQKVADIPYQSRGSNVTWTLMAANITYS